MIGVVPTPGGVRVPIRVVPRASKTVVGGERDGRLLVRVTAPPVDGAANEAAMAALAAALGVPRRQVQLVSGATSRNKVLEVTGLTNSAVIEALALLHAVQ